jgi:FAD/FMN-containing dehydrogenase/Fe-S oxidoreductase
MTNRHAVARDLGRLVRGEVLFDEVSRLLYSTAACMYQIEPLGVVVPRDAEDVRAVVGYAAERGFPLIGRGAGSSLNGQALGRGIVLDFTKYMRTVVSVDPGGRTAVVQPGVVLKQLNRGLAKHGLWFAPDPSSGDQATIGGMIGANAAGARSLKYGSTRDHVRRIRGVLADGESLVTSDGADDGVGEGQRRIEGGLRALLTENAGLIEKCRPRVNKNSSGYCLDGVADDSRTNLIPLLVGSEGTLALVTEATLNLLPLPLARGTALFFLAELAAAGEGVCELLGRQPCAIEIVDDKFLKLARIDNATALEPVPPETKYMLLVEFEGEDAAAVARSLAAAEQRLVRETRLAFAAELATEAPAQQKLWAVRKAATPVLNRMEGPRRPISVIEDAAVAPERLVEYITGLQEIMDRHGVEATLHGHAGNGHLHVRPVLDLKRTDDLERLKSITQSAADLVQRLRGTLSAEHGDGLCRTQFLPQAFGELYSVFVQVKRLFDPLGLLNPGKKVFVEGMGVADNLRYGAEYRRVHTHTAFDSEPLQTQAERCHGCGSCRDYCPVFVGTGDEAAAARAKANLLRRVISGGLPPDALEDAQFKRVMDLCVNCRQCLTDCPTLVDIPTLAVKARAHCVAKRGQQLRNLLLGYSDQTSRAGQASSAIANAVNEFQPWRALMEHLVGLHRDRQFPQFARRSYRQWLADNALQSPSPDGTVVHRVPATHPSPPALVYFAGCFAHYCDPEGEAIAATEVLRRNGYEVIVPEFRCCGIALLTLGSGDRVRPDAERNIARLLPYVRKGTPVVVSSASCCLALKEDYPALVGSPEAREVSRGVFDVHEFLLSLHGEGKLDTASLGPVRRRVTYHNPCHLKAQGLSREPLRLLRLIPELDIVEIEDSCCGIAGTFGMKKENYALSMRMGAPLFDAIASAGVDCVASGCGTCNLQIKQATGIEVVHPVKLLHEAYEVGSC